MRNINFLLKTFLVGVMMLCSFDGYSQSLVKMKTSKKRKSGNETCTVCDLFKWQKFSFKLNPAQFPVKVESIRMTSIDLYDSSTPSSRTYRSSSFPLKYLLDPATGNLITNQIVYANSNLISPSGHLEFTTEYFDWSCTDISVTESDLSPEPIVLFSVAPSTESVLGPVVHNPLPTYKFRLQVIYSYLDPYTGTTIQTITESFDFDLNDSYDCVLGSSNSQNTLFGKNAPNNTTHLNNTTPADILVDVWPNPFSRKITISYSKRDQDMVDISLFDIQGHEIKLPSGVDFERKKGNRVSLNLESLPNGIYYLKVVSIENIEPQVLKVIKAN